MESKNPTLRRKPTYFKVAAERWLTSSTRGECNPTERALWIDLLALGALYGGIVEVPAFKVPGAGKPNFKILAQQLGFDEKLVETTFQLFETYGKLSKTYDKKEVKFYYRILKWEEYQSPFLWGKLRKPRKKAGEDDVRNNVSSPVSNPDIGEERRGKERIGKDIRGDKIREEKSGESPPSPQKTEFFKLLQSLSGPSYPFQEKEDGQVFDLFSSKYPKVNIIEQTEKKIEYWRDHPSALRAHKKGPRTQLVDWLLHEAEYQDGQK